MKIQGFLDHLLKSSSGNGSVLNADFGKGAITGGALGLLLGKNKTSRKLATYGGLAAIGVMAYRAYNDYKQQQGGFAAGAGPQTVDRLPPPQAELHSQAILKALVAAAKADGHIDARDREVIEGEFSRIGTDGELQQAATQQQRRRLNALRRLQHINGKCLKQESEPVVLLGPRNRNCLYSACRT